MTTLLCNTGLWMFSEKPLPAITDDDYDFVCNTPRLNPNCNENVNIHIGW
jgi:hypothetical protein